MLRKVVPKEVTTAVITLAVTISVRPAAEASRISSVLRSFSPAVQSTAEYIAPLNRKISRRKPIMRPTKEPAILRGWATLTDALLKGSITDAGTLYLASSAR